MILDTPMTAGKKSIAARALRIVGFATIALVLLAALAYVLRGPLFGKVAAEKLAAVLSRELGGQITIDSVEGDVVRELVLVGVRLAVARSSVRAARNRPRAHRVSVPRNPGR